MPSRSLRSSGLVLLVVIAAACLLHNRASAEAYSSLAARRSKLWSRSFQKSIGDGNSIRHHHCPDDLRLSTMLKSSGGGTDESKSTSFWNKRLARELLAEMIGTGLIVQIGTGAVMSAVYSKALVGLFQIASAWIIAVTLAIACTGPISGAHLNPAISICFAMFRPSKTFGWAKVIPYCFAQVVGASLGSCGNLLLYAPRIREFEAASDIVRGASSSIASAKAFGQYFEQHITSSTMTAFYAEALGTAILAFVVFSLTNSKNDAQKNNVYIPPLIGATVGGLIAAFGPLTQAGFNPARDFGPRIVAWLAGWDSIAFQGWWVYVLAPIVGAPIGAFVADRLLYGGDDAE